MSEKKSPESGSEPSTEALVSHVPEVLEPPLDQAEDMGASETKKKTDLQAVQKEEVVAADIPQQVEGSNISQQEEGSPPALSIDDGHKNVLQEDSPEVVEAAFKALKAAALKKGDLPLKERKQLLKKLKKQIASSRQLIIDVLKKDYADRSDFQTLAVDYFAPMVTIKSTLQSIDDWVEPDDVDSFWIFWPGKSQVQYCAKGVVAIIVPWNYPFYLSLIPIIGAIAAGNRVLVKPSELAPQSSKVLFDLLSAVFPDDIVRVVQGGVATSVALTELPLDHIFFTGSSAVGKKVMAAASQNLVPVTLELGGKSPAVIHPSYSLTKAITKILNGKLMNGGQSCFAPDYILCSKGTEAEIEQIIEKVQSRLFPTIESNNDYGAIISDNHLSRLKNLIEDARQKGARIVEVNPSREKTTHKLPLHLVFNATDEMLVMQEEIFGPILPIVTYNNVDDIFEYINSRPTPLCAYYFDKRSSRIREFTQKVRAGGITINDIFYHIAQENLPFSGFGNSGMGAYHGWYSFLTFSHQKAVFQHSGLSPVSLILGAPYKAWAKKILRFLAWW